MTAEITSVASSVVRARLFVEPAAAITVITTETTMKITVLPSPYTEERSLSARLLTSKPV